MGQYVHGFVIPMPAKNTAAYQKIAKLACKVWMEHGALDYRECILDDPKTEEGISFPALAQAKKSETVVFAWITYKSKKDAERVMKKVMEDPRLTGMMDQKMPFDMKRMTYGGFETLVKA